ncbi:hypothetical protein KY285_009553 [Solanum tuberosum]|nr:hypothetical protein KY285_009553 [Solanum tuberosum]
MSKKNVEEQIVWDRHLPRKYLDNEIVWNDNDFIPNNAKKEYLHVFQACYVLYLRQICESDGFDIDIYPGVAKAAIYIPYLDFEKEADMFMELANHAIHDYNNVETNEIHTTKDPK